MAARGVRILGSSAVLVAGTAWRRVPTPAGADPESKRPWFDFWSITTPQPEPETPPPTPTKEPAAPELAFVFADPVIDEAEPDDATIVAAAKRIRPAVVTLCAPRGQNAVYGTGVVLDRTGLVVTNAHVLREGEKWVARLEDGRMLSAKPLAFHNPADVGLLQLLDPPPDLPVATLNNNGPVRIGDDVITVGSAGGCLRLSVSKGIVSEPARYLEGLLKTVLIQHDALIVGGCSGGPLCNAQGEVVGINVLRCHEFNFAIPIKDVLEVVNTLVQREEVQRPYLGLEVGSARSVQNEDMYIAIKAAAADGPTVPAQTVTVVKVLPDSPAQQAGVMVGDEVLAVDGHAVLNGDVARARLGFAPGRTVRLTIRRGVGGSVETVDVVSTKIPESVREAKSVEAVRRFDAAQAARVGTRTAAFHRP